LVSNLIFKTFFLNFLDIFRTSQFEFKVMWQAVLKTDLLHWIVEPQLNGGWRHNYSSKTRLAGHAKEQPIYSLLSMSLFTLHRPR
jgi:hypothetical protein